MDMSRQFNGAKPKKIRIFCCYAHEDQPLLLKLKVHLAPLQRENLITLRADTDINAGMEWKKEIHHHLNEAQIILLLVSPDFVASEYCYSVEMTQAMERHVRGEAWVIPIILRPTYWQNAPFGKLQALPSDAKPIMSSDWYNSDEAFFNVTLGIRKVITYIFPKIDTVTRPRRIPANWSESEQQALERWLGEGEKYHRNHHYIEALVAYERAALLAPDKEAAWIGKGDVLYDSCQYEKALAAYEQSIVIVGGLGNYYRKGITLFTLKRYEEALVAYQQAVDDWMHFRIFSGLIAHQPTDSLQSAVDLMLHICPSKAAVHRCKGDIFYCLEQYEKALSHYEQVVKLETDNVDNYYIKARVLCHLDRDKEALTTLDQAALVEPSNFMTYHGKSKILHSLSQYNEAVKAIDQAISLSSYRSGLYTDKGDILVDCKQYEEALTAFEMAIMSLSPNSYFLRHIYEKMRDIFECLGREKEAKQAHKKFASIEPQSEVIEGPLKLRWGPDKYRRR